jgi:hypothetical protein
MNYDRRSVGQSVLVSSPIWGSRPDINYYLTVTVFFMSGAPSDERSGLSFVFFFLVSLGGVRLSPLGTSATVGLLYQPRMIDDDDDDYGAVG